MHPVTVLGYRHETLHNSLKQLLKVIVIVQSPDSPPRAPPNNYT